MRRRHGETGCCALMMAWVAADRSVKAVERFRLDGPVKQWRRLRADIKGEVCKRGWDADQAVHAVLRQRRTRRRAAHDAARRFLPTDDERVRGTVAAIDDALAGRLAQAKDTFGRLVARRNDVGLLAEEYDVAARRQVGNFPQAFSHVPLINTARNLTFGGEPGQRRSDEHEPSAGHPDVPASAQRGGSR